MVSAIQRIGAAIRSAPRSVSEINADNLTRPFKPARAWYERLEAYARNEPYSVINAANAAYKAAHGLPRDLRPLYNPFPRAASWYPGHVYPPDTDVIPFAAGTPEELTGPIVTAFEVWGNWQRERTIYVRTGARLGNVFIELEADFESGRVYPRVIHPAYITDIELNHRGDVLMYHIEIPRVDPRTEQGYRYGKRVTRETITTYYGDDERGYDGDPATLENPFPFAPGVWVPHFSTGELLGAGVADGVLGKIDALNSIASSVHSYIQKFNRQGVAFASEGNVTTLKAAIEQQNQQRRTAFPLADPYADAQEITYLKGPADLRVFKLIDNLGIGEAFQYLTDMRDELEADLPEVTFDRELRSMAEVSGVAAMRMSGDVVNRLGEAQGNYDWGVKRAGAMAVTMGALMFRAMEARGLTDQQRAFLEFDAESYELGQLSFSLADRPLLPSTPAERVAYAESLERISTPTGLEIAGLEAKQIYGVDEEGKSREPEQREGILAEKEDAQSRSSTAFGRAFNAGF